MTTVCGSGADTLKFFPPTLQQVLNRGMENLVVRDLETEQHVFGGDRMTVRKCGALPQVERPRHAVGATSQDLASSGSNCWVPLS